MAEFIDKYATDPTLVYPIVGSRPRSTHWRSVADTFLKTHTSCEGCGTNNRKNLQVHHVKPYHLFPELELVPDNLVAACKFCHFVLCHQNNWSFCVEDVREELARHWHRGQKTIKAVPVSPLAGINFGDSIVRGYPKFEDRPERYASYSVVPDTTLHKILTALGLRS